MTTPVSIVYSYYRTKVTIGLKGKSCFYRTTGYNNVKLVYQLLMLQGISNDNFHFDVATLFGHVQNYFLHLCAILFIEIGFLGMKTTMQSSDLL